MVGVVAAMGGADCEALRAGWLAQPANAVSSLAYVSAGLWVLWRSRGDGRKALVIAGALGLIGAGAGSFAYHGPQPGWAAAAHDSAIGWLVLVFVALVVAGLGGGEGRRASVMLMMKAWKPAAAWLVPAVAAYAAGRTGSALCRPSSFWQHHAVWHGLSSAALSAALLRTSRQRRAKTTSVQRASRIPSMPAERWPGSEQ